MTSFQFSPVSMINMVIKAVKVSPKEYLEISPSSSSRGSEKNCLQSRAKINRKRTMRIPRLVMACSDSNTVDRRTLS